MEKRSDGSVVVNVGILGAGGIAGTMANTLNLMAAGGISDIRLCAVAARDSARAEAFAKRFGIPKAYGSYEEMLQDPEPDLVYVATPHSHHRDHVMLCIQHGKHVLCEKAFTQNGQQAREVLAAAKAAGVLVTEAIWTRYQPSRKLVEEVLQRRPVGEPRTITANLSYRIIQNERIREPHLAGGALLDVGVYTLNFAEMFFGRADDRKGTCTYMPTGVDETDAIFLTWKDGRSAILNAGTTCRGDRFGTIYCENGYIQVENINNPQKIRIFDDSDQLLEEISVPEQFTGYEYEVMEAAEMIRQGKLECPSMPHEETIYICEEMDELRRQMGVRYPGEA